ARGRVLLEKRPPAGVWAELWSLPEAESPDAAPTVARRVGAQAARFEPLDPFVHAFTHYRLEVSPFLAHAEPLPLVADGDRVRWCGERELAALGLPSPVKKLLQTLHSGTVQMFGD
ncbi:MAG TPA: NUDIX domain-containing protein, partial [Tahibacter sp.]|nr:NUDIX domain-containing protein [Tahibacter sp.]